MLFRFCLYGFLKNQRYFEPFLMLFFLQQGLSFFAIGLLVAVRDITVNLLEIPSGAWADSFGRRTAMMFAFAAYIASFVLFAMGTAAWEFALAMILFGVGDSFRTGTHKAMIFQWLRMNGQEDQRTRVYGLTRSWSKIGSAVSGLIAAAFVLISGNYAYVFWFAIIPYAANLINFAGYPCALDGDHEKASSLGESTRRLWQSTKNIVRQRPLRKLVFESMGWEGYFNAAKDYLQPALAALALLTFARFWPDNSLDDTRKTALLIGPVYAVLFILSAAASRHAHRLVTASGSESAAARRLWQVNAVALGLLAVAAWLQWVGIVVVLFVSLHVLQNVWRPILVSRFDEHGRPEEGATILSVESQAQRLASLLLAPLLGWCVDWVTQHTPAAPLWPLGVIGALIALALVARNLMERSATASTAG